MQIDKAKYKIGTIFKNYGKNVDYCKKLIV